MHFDRVDAAAAAGIAVVVGTLVYARRRRGLRVSLPASAAEAAAYVHQYAPIFGAPESLVMTILGIESAYRAGLVNQNDRAAPKGGAWGLGQITLDTAKDVTKRFPSIAAQYWPKFVKAPVGMSLLDPRENAAMACFILGRLYTKYKSHADGWKLAAVAYHQGSGTIDKHLAARGKLDPTALAPFGRIYYGMILKATTSKAPVVAALQAENRRILA
jgi:transglycosylase-like protein with SLT domain